MPLAKIHLVEGRYDEARIAKVSDAIQVALMNTLRVPPDDFYQLIFALPKQRFLHTRSFVGMHYTDDPIIPLILWHPTVRPNRQPRARPSRHARVPSPQ